MPSAASLRNLIPYKPGQSGNPGGVSREVVNNARAALDYCTKNSLQYVQALEAIALDEKNHASVRRQALVDLLDRGGVKPELAIKFMKDDNDKRLDLNQLRTIVAERLTALDPGIVAAPRMVEA